MKRAKIILLGPGEAGKTTLLHRLVHGKFEGGYGMTDGINMTEMVIDDLKFIFWDFSGQHIYFNTHLLFFSEQALYLLVWNPRQHEHYSYVRIYLNMIRNYAPLAPVILVTTHAKDTSRVTDYTLKMIQNNHTQEPSICSLDPFYCSSSSATPAATASAAAASSATSSATSSAAYGSAAASASASASSSTVSASGYGPICCYHHIDSLTGIGIQEFKKDLVKYALQQPWVVQRVPKIFKKLEMGLKELSQHGRFSLTRNEFLKYCWEVFKIDEENSIHALELFHTWGVIHLLSSSPSSSPDALSPATATGAGARVGGTMGGSTRPLSGNSSSVSSGLGPFLSSFSSPPHSHSFLPLLPPLIPPPLSSS
jgi:GTPase SAR1 family protein